MFLRILNRFEEKKQVEKISRYKYVIQYPIGNMETAGIIEGVIVINIPNRINTFLQQQVSKDQLVKG